MQAVRRLLAQRRIVLPLCVLGLLLKLLVPTGYMVGNEHGRITITICSGMAPRTMTMVIPGADHEMPDHGQFGDHGKAEQPCAFAGLSAPMLGPIDPLLLAALIAFVMATALAIPLPPAPMTAAYLRPPLRGPPAQP